MWLPAADVARIAVAGLEQGRAVVIPGFANRVGAQFGRTMPAPGPGGIPRPPAPGAQVAASPKVASGPCRARRPRPVRPSSSSSPALRGRGSRPRPDSWRSASTAAACLESDWFWTTIVKGFVPPWRPEADAPEPGRAAAPLAESAAALAAAGYAVVVDGIVGPWYLGLVTEPLARHGVETHYVVLRPSLEVTLARVASGQAEERRRGLLASAFADEEPVTHMWKQFSDLGALERHVVDNADSTPRRPPLWSGRGSREEPTGCRRIGTPMGSLAR